MTTEIATFDHLRKESVTRQGIRPTPVIVNKPFKIWEHISEGESPPGKDLGQRTDPEILPIRTRGGYPTREENDQSRTPKHDQETINSDDETHRRLYISPNTFKHSFSRISLRFILEDMSNMRIQFVGFFNFLDIIR